MAHQPEAHAPENEIADERDGGPLALEQGVTHNALTLARAELSIVGPQHGPGRHRIDPHRRRQLDLSPEQFNFPWCMEEQSSPLLSNSANMMLSAMFSTNTFADLVNPQTMGPAEAFFPFPSEANTADESSTAPPSLQGDGDEAEKKLDISDFITWDGDSSGDEADADWEPSSTPLRPSTAGSCPCSR